MDKEQTPDFIELGRIKLRNGKSEFNELRSLCYEIGLNLERKGSRGYRLEGLDLPVSGVECRNLDEVRDEVSNYGDTKG